VHHNRPPNGTSKTITSAHQTIQTKMMAKLLLPTGVPRRPARMARHEKEERDRRQRPLEWTRANQAAHERKPHEVETL